MGTALNSYSRLRCSSLVLTALLFPQGFHCNVRPVTMALLVIQMGGIQSNTAAGIADVQVHILDVYRDVLWSRTHSRYLWKDKNVQRARRTAYRL